MHLAKYNLAKFHTVGKILKKKQLNAEHVSKESVKVK